ncbi:pitrilysin family protein [uncultured Mailhella sp.]|uniref:M16 family metallopeptidase n=1 Tax=uncultured Mailhella sp. TaxID=1981031 RepID=UPI00261CC02B|nr:pitrilysin family protein [uncultured Mailhella sp.]
MRFRTLFAGAALTFSFLLGAVPYCTASASSDVQTYRLQNGLSVLIKEDRRFPLVSVRLFVKAGSAWEKPEEAGLSHLLEHMVFKGSKTSGAGVDKLVENAGGSMNAYTSYDMTTYLTDLPSAQWKTALRAVRDLAFDPLLKQEDLDAEREVVIAEKKQRGDNPMTRLFQTALGHTLKGTPYEFPVIGKEDTLRKATPQMMRAYIERRYDPRDMVLVVVGDVQSGPVLGEAKELFGGYENRNILRVESSFEPAELARGLVVDVQPGPWNKAFVSLSFPLPGMRDELLPAADVLAHLLAGDDTALLPRRFRIDAPVVDEVSTSAMNFERAGAFLILAQMDADKVETFLHGVGETLAMLKAADFTDAQIARARLNLEDSYLRAQEKISGIAELLGHEYFYDPSSLGGERYLSAVRHVDHARLQQVIERWLRPDALSVTALVPAAVNASGLNGEKARQSLMRGWPGAAQTADKDTARKKAANLRPDIVPLGEGRTLVLLPDPSLPYVSATLAFSGGELLARDEEEGLAALTAAALTTGTASRTRSDIDLYLSERASSLGAGSALRQFTVQLDAPAHFRADILSLMKEVLEQPAFRTEDVERVRREQLAAIASSEDSAMGLLGRNLRHFLFPVGPYGHRDAGAPARVAAYTRDDVAAFWKKQAARPWVLSVAGDFDREEILRFAASLPQSVEPPLTAEKPKWTSARTLDLKLPGRDQAVYLILFPTAGTDSPDRPALRLLSEALSGFTGKLYQDLREKQSLGYSVFPVDWADRKTGFLGFGIIASPENLDRARASFERIVGELRAEPLPEQTLERARATAFTDYYRARQSRAVRAAEGAANVLNERPLDYALQNLEKMERLTSEDLRRTAETYLDLKRAYQFTVTP